MYCPYMGLIRGEATILKELDLMAQLIADDRGMIHLELAI